MVHHTSRGSQLRLAIQTLYGTVAKYLSTKNRNFCLEKQGLRKPYNDQIDSDEPGKDPLKKYPF
jgi:hypothetical protein